VADSEELDQAALDLERIMLRLRTARGLDLAALAPAGRRAVPGLVADGLVTVTGAGDGADGIVLTRRGRLLGDLVTRSLITNS
jgi:oxygen-independent coproporphyrinogen-3 oxidase